MPFPRSAGVLLHPTSLPSRYGIGDLGSSAYSFIDFLVRAKQQLWQVLPLGPTGYGNSPYMCYSSLAGSPLLISLDRLQEDGFLDEADLQHRPEFSPDWVDYDRVIEYKMPLLQRACKLFFDRAELEQRQAFDQFCQEKAAWLDDYALFMALKAANDNQSWHTWTSELAQRDPVVLQEVRQALADEIRFHQYLQFVFFQQWTALKTYAAQHHIQIIGDIPIYVAHDSADVWAQPKNFCLDEETFEPALMAGVPPDYFSETGQLWGNPVYDWEYLQKTNFAWWIGRFRAILELVDLIRIDHFRGFEAFWAVPNGETTAINGEWVTAPGAAFFERLGQELGNLPILAEDLGIITPEVEALRDRFAFPGMKVLQFAFGSDRYNPFLPYNHVANSLVYTGTHDNDTTLGWYSQIPDYERQNLHRYMGCFGYDGIQWDVIRLAMASVANQCIVPLQDILGLGTEARMNFPGKPEGNWAWRYRPEMLADYLADRLAYYTELYGRHPHR